MFSSSLFLFVFFSQANIKCLAVALIVSLTCVQTLRTSEQRYNDIETTSRSIVSRLDPALRKALLKALSNLETESATDEASATTSSTLRDEQLLEQSTAADLQALNLYNHFIVNGANYTQKAKDDNEIIHTIIVKAPKSTVPPIESDADRAEDPNDQVVIRFEHPDPVKESDVRVETLQIPRSVKTNEIANEFDVETELDDGNQATTLRPTTTPAITTTDALPTTTITTTKAPTHNEDGENIEKVGKNDVKIFAAPLVAAFTVHQDALGQPKNVVSLIDTFLPSPIVAKPIQEFLLPLTSTNTPFDPNLKPSTLSTTPIAESTFSLAQSLELPTTKEATFTKFALNQKQKQLEDQILFLQKQHREREDAFRQQQLIQEQQSLNRQQQLLLQQRYRYEEENRVRLQRYEQEQRLIRQQHQLKTLPTPSFEPSFTPINSSPPQSSSVQIIPSLSFPSVQIPTQQLLPVREQVEFHPETSTIEFQTQQSLGLLPPPLPQGLTLPIQSNNELTQSRNRVFRQESGAGNAGLNSVNTNFPPFASNSFDFDGQWQNLLFRSGFGDVRANEDLNIISKVLALNHGIPKRTDSLFPTNANLILGRFARSANVEKY